MGRFWGVAILSWKCYNISILEWFLIDLSIKN
jgi:hypothetical protein